MKKNQMIGIEPGSFSVAAKQAIKGCYLLQYILE